MPMGKGNHPGTYGPTFGSSEKARSGYGDRSSAAQRKYHAAYEKKEAKETASAVKAGQAMKMKYPPRGEGGTGDIRWAEAKTESLKKSREVGRKLAGIKNW